jgi:hypothetical protein
MPNARRAIKYCFVSSAAAAACRKIYPKTQQSQLLNLGIIYSGRINKSFAYFCTCLIVEDDSSKHQRMAHTKKHHFGIAILRGRFVFSL